MISGANRGIGRAIAEILHAKGYAVSAGARHSAVLESVLSPLTGERLLCARYEAGEHGTRRIGWEHGVRATALYPSFVATDLTARVTKVARGEMIEPADLAELAATAIALPSTAAMAEMLVNC